MRPLPLIAAVCLLVGRTAVADEYDDLMALLGGRHGKIVAHDRNDGNKLYVFDTEARTFSKLSADIECYQPLLSPDGTRLVYERGGAVYIRALDGSAATKIVEGYDGHWWVDDNDDEWIYYTTIGDNPDDTARKVWYPNNGKGIQTRRIRLRDNQDELLLDWKGSAGPSMDGIYLGAAYSTMIIFEVATGTAHVVNGNNQGCNGSMSPDSRYYLMHLELPHTFFCYRDRNDNRVWNIENPTGTEEWQDPEFSTHPDFATATAKEDSGRYSVWAVKISTKEMVKVLDVANGSDWAEPHLWVEDSGGVEDGGSDADTGGDGAGEDGAGEDDAGEDDAGTTNDEAGADPGADAGPGDAGEGTPADDDEKSVISGGCMSCDTVPVGRSGAAALLVVLCWRIRFRKGAGT